MSTYLIHHGIKGQRWGVRRFENEDGSLTPAGKRRYSREEKRAMKADAKHRKTASKMARKDAEEFARAKMFYGKGAGNRRKLIKATVDERSKDPYYKEYFDQYLSQQDMAKHAKKAASERHRKDVTEGAAKTARGAINAANGNLGAASASGVAVYRGFRLLRNLGVI